MMTTCMVGADMRVTSARSGVCDMGFRESVSGRSIRLPGSYTIWTLKPAPKEHQGDAQNLGVVRSVVIEEVVVVAPADDVTVPEEMRVTEHGERVGEVLEHVRRVTALRRREGVVVEPDSGPHRSRGRTGRFRRRRRPRKSRLGRARGGCD